MPTRTAFLALAFFAFAGSVVGSTLPDRPRFAHETSDLKVDPAVRFGTLPNGLRYAVRQNKEPKERASLRLLVLGGSLHENDDQRGLAHFLEHMAFNGSTHYPPGTLIEFFQRMGMEFGADTNAYTSFDHTAYQLELPDTKAQTVAEGFKVFADYAGGLLLGEKEIDRERGIILSEKRTSDSVEFRQMLAEFDFVLGTTRLPKRMPIGETSVIEKATFDRFRDFYDAWYRPERMAVVAVGDFDPASIEAQIKEALSAVVGRGQPRANPALGTIDRFEGVRVKHHFEPEAAKTVVSIQSVLPYIREPDTKATRLKYVPRSLAVTMLNRRLSILAKKENAPFSRGRAEAGHQFDFVHNASIELDCKPAQWADALAVADQELRRALEHGFQPAELREAVANEINALEQDERSAATRRSNDLADSLVSVLASGYVFTTPAGELELFKPVLETVTVEQCTQALREAFQAAGRYVSVMGNAKIEGDVVAAIANAYEASSRVAVRPSETLADAAFAYTDFGPAGKIVRRQQVEDLDVSLFSFENGVRLNLKKTDFEADRIILSVRIGTGQLTEPKNKPGLALFAGSTLAAGGLGKHSADDLQRILAGKTVGLGFNVTSDAFSFRASTNQHDFLLQLQLLAAFVVDAGYRTEALRQVQKRIEQVYIKVQHTPEGPLQQEVPRLLAGGDPRFGLPPQAALTARTLEEARAWLAPEFQHGAIEIAVVGDLQPEAVIDAVGRTFGALPPRREKPVIEEARRIDIPAPFTRLFTVQTEIPKGIVAIYWHTTDGRDVKVARRLRTLADVFNDRLRIRIREELGDAYSPSAGSATSDTYRNYGHLVSRIVVDPDKAAKVADTILEIAADLHRNGVTADELERAKKPLLTGLRESARQNDYWLGSVLSSAQESPERLDWARTRLSDAESITKEEVSALAAQYLVPDRAYRVTVLPEKTPAAAGEKTAPKTQASETGK